MCSIQWYFVCGNKLYTFITGDTVKQTVDGKQNYCEEINSIFNIRNVTKYCKCLIKYSVYCMLLTLLAIIA